MVGGLASKRRSATPAGGRAALSRGAGPRYCRNTRQIPLKMPAPVPLPRGGPAPAYAASGAMPDLTPRAAPAERAVRRRQRQAAAPDQQEHQKEKSNGPRRCFATAPPAKFP